jgi:3-deoxy-7-phosphoheptulonate synthase
VSAEFDQRRTWGPKPTYPHVLTAERTDKLPELITIAGPCSVECEEQVEKVVPELSREGVTFARGGVYRAGTYPRLTNLTARGNRIRPPLKAPFGLQKKLMKAWARACNKAGLPVIMEVLDVREAKEMAAHCDAFQVGARHMQDYAMLVELAKYDRPVALKRGVGQTLDEFLGAAEYLARGRCTPMLIERGSATHMNHVRWDLSISTIAAIKQMTKLPVLVDASHGTGRRDLVRPMTMAGMAAGADGFLVEVHPDPRNSLSDADQALPLEQLGPLKRVARAVGNLVSGDTYTAA